MVSRLVAVLAFCLCATVVFWYALVHTVHRGTMSVPELRGLATDEAERLSHDLGLRLEVEERGVFSATLEPGLVATQDPHPGFHVKTGSKVSVRLSLGGQRVAVPDLRGESLQTGLRTLEQVGLRSGYRARVRGLVAGDSIVSTEPPAGAEVAPGSEVSLLINATPRNELWVMPSLLSHSREQVRLFCRKARLRLGQVHEVPYPGLRAGVVVRQYPPAGSPIARSDIVAIWVSQ